MDKKEEPKKQEIEASKTEEVQDEKKVKGSAQEQELTELDTTKAECAKLKQELEEANKKIVSLNEDMLRVRADGENYRKRLIRDKEEAVQFANLALITDLLQPLDDFKRAMNAAKSTRDFDKIQEGVELVSKKMYDMLEKNWGLEEMNPDGQEFDPSKHEACMMVQDEKLEKEIVLQTLATGYTLHGRVLRPAKVKVGKPNN
ncbi:MAG: nucleotide exchange factor GrpE [Sphaerochaetaceae bacterium]